MPETDRHDDAPNATAKHTHGEREIASHAVTINRPLDEVFGLYADLTKAPLYMDGVERVDVDGSRAHWVTEQGEWDAEITKLVPGQEMYWQAEESSGRAVFQEVPGRGTIVTLTMAYEQGFLAKIAAKLSQKDPSIQSRRNLRRLKQLLETGEIATNARNRRMQAEENV